MRSSDPKIGKYVEARTVRGTDYVRGKVVDIATGRNGTWYSIQPKGDDAFKTRRACIK